MIKFEQNISLQGLNTLNLPAVAEYFATLSDPNQVDEIIEFAHSNNLPILWLGGGSNLVLADQVPGLVVKIALSGVDLLTEDDEKVVVRVGAGVNWHQFVEQSVENGWFGLENLALIPGTVGAAPVQNIGAYGAEFADRCHSVEVVDLLDQSLQQLRVEQCRFGYRDSLFKQNPGRYLILNVQLKLSKQFTPNLGYAALDNQLQAMGVAKPTAGDVFNAVVQVRSSKLPNPEELPNAGSFFKNPVVSAQHFQELKTRYPSMPSYADEQGVKLAAGWLIDQAGFRGLRDQHVGMHADQALVLVNHNGATRTDVDQFSARVAGAVFEKFAVQLEQEPVPYP